VARPKKLIDKTEVEKLAAMGCNDTEIASFCDCSVDTINRRFAEILKKGREKGKTKLRRLQWQSAEKGNVTMQIWLGKQLLGQRDYHEAPVVEAKVDGKAQITIRWTDEPDAGATEADTTAAKV
jgi:hypothetical protein